MILMMLLLVFSDVNEEVAGQASHGRTSSRRTVVGILVYSHGGNAVGEACIKTKINAKGLCSQLSGEVWLYTGLGTMIEPS
jgi:hypothetical protein